MPNLTLLITYLRMKVLTFLLVPSLCLGVSIKEYDGFGSGEIIFGREELVEDWAELKVDHGSGLSDTFTICSSVTVRVSLV